MNEMTVSVETARLEKDGAVVLAHRQFRDGAEVWVLNIEQIAGQNGLSELPAQVRSQNYECVSVEERDDVAEGLLDALLSNREAELKLRDRLKDNFVAALPNQEPAPIDSETPPTPDPS